MTRQEGARSAAGGRVALGDQAGEFVAPGVAPGPDLGVPAGGGVPQSPRGASRTPWVTHSCGARWTGTRPAHCAACHVTFSSDAAFDAHRRGGGVCLDPATAVHADGSPRFELRRNGTWGGWVSPEKRAQWRESWGERRA